MNPLRQFLRRLRALFHRDALDRELDEELRFHLEMQARENTESGIASAEAAHLARRQLGHLDTVKEIIRTRRGFAVLENLARDLRFAMRSLQRSPGYTLAVVAILATSIGLVTAIVNVSRRVLLPDIPYPEAERVVILRERKPPGTGYWWVLSYRFTRYAEHTISFTALAAERTELTNLVAGGEPTAVRMACVTEQFFAALGVACNQGRAFFPEEHLPGATGATVVLSHQAWTRYFGRDPAVLGQEVMLGDQLRRIVGILPPSFRAPRDFEDDGIYLPTLPDPAPTPGQNFGVNVIGRLKPGVTLEQAEAELRTTSQEAPSPTPQTSNNAQLEAVLTSLRDVYLEKGAQPFRIFLGAVGLLYLIGCTAVTNLMLSRTVARRRELGVRLALGGSRRQVMALVLGEALTLSLFAAAIGTMIAWWTQRGMTQLLPPGVSGEDLRHGFNGATIGIAIGLGTLTCVVAGLIPAWRASRASLNESLKEGAGAQGESRRLRFLRSVFVVAQGALAVALLIGAGLMIESVYRLQHIDLGFDPADKIVLLGSRRGAGDRATLAQLNKAIVERIAALPEVAHAAESSTVPLIGAVSMASFTVDGRSESESVGFYIFNVSADFFASLNLPLIAGRSFGAVHPGDPPVAMIDEATARQLFPSNDAIGRFLTLGNNRVEVIGVVRSIVVGYRGMVARTASGPITAQIYRPIQQTSPNRSVNAILRVPRKPGPDFAATVRRLVHEIDPSVIVSLRSLGEFIEEQTRAERHTLTMLQILSALALVLAAFGMFSVMAYTVAQRRGELGLRMVLGATPGRLVMFVMKRGLILAVVGVVLGIAAAAGLTRFMRGLLYETSPFEPVTYVVVAVLLLAAAGLACWLPARRAAKVDPVIALRAE